MGRRRRGPRARGIAIPGVDHRAADPPLAQRRIQRRLLHHAAAPDIEDHRIGPHGPQRRGIDQPRRLRQQRQGSDNEIGRPHERVQPVEAPGAIDPGHVDRAAVADMDAKPEGPRPDRHLAPDMAIAQQPDGPPAQFLMRRIALPGPECPAFLPQIRIRPRQIDQPQQQRRHHVFGNGMLMLEHIAQARRGRRAMSIASYPAPGT